MKWIHFILSHSIFVSFCAVALSLQTALLLQSEVPTSIYLFIFFATMCSYNFYWLLSKYYHATFFHFTPFIKKNASLVLVFFCSFFSCIYFISIQSKLIPLVSIAVVLTLLYALPFLSPFFIIRNRFFKSILLAFTWAYTTLFLPYFAEQKITLLQVDSAFLLLFISRFCFMLLLCIIFERRDAAAENDEEGNRTETLKRMQLFFMAVWLVYLVSSVAFCYANENILQALVFLLLGIACAIFYRLSFIKRNYLFYYFYVDGLMLCSAAASYVVHLFTYKP